MIAALIGFLILLFATLPSALTVWSYLPIATISTVETFIEFLLILHFFINKWADKSKEGKGNAIRLIFTFFAIFFVLLVICVASRSFPLASIPLFGDVPVLEDFAEGFALIYNKVHSFFERIVLAIRNFAGS